MNVEDVRAKREEILRIASRHGARNLRIFGSVARGEAGSESDIDLLVERSPTRTPFFPGGLLQDLQDLLGRRVQVVTELALHPRIREQVLKESIPL